jgi:hypothetical protein
MKKLFTLVALLAMFLGAKAETVVDAEIDFSKYSDISEFKFAGWGASESALARLTIENGCLHFHSEEATDPSWDCQFHPIGGVEVEEGVTYTLHYKVKGTVEQNISALGFETTPYGKFPITTEWVEGTFDYVAAKSAGGDILMQCGDYIGDFDIAYLKITHEGKANARPEVWVQQLENGDAEKSWADLGLDGVKFNDQKKNFKICAWGKVKNENMNDDGGWDPVPAQIVEDPDKPGNHVFVVKAALADTEGDASAWDNQFWIQSPKSWKAGTKVRVKFRYKASQEVNTNTQVHKQNPSDYLHWQAVGDVKFTTEWQEFENTFTFDETQAGAWSIAFNLNPEIKTPTEFYFDDLSWEALKLDEGYFVAGSNPDAGIEYDFDNATELTYNEGEGAYIATIGAKDAYVSQVMISTIRGNNSAFKGSTIKPKGDVVLGEWLDYSDAASAKILLPGLGIWKVSIDVEYGKMMFELLKGDEIALLEIKPNPTEVVVKGQERDWLSNGNEEEVGAGEAWDNQFFIVTNRPVKAGEKTIIKFKYKASTDAKVTTQSHELPGNYIHWAAIGDINFTTEWQDFEATFTIPNECNGEPNNADNPTFNKNFRSIAFNMAEIKEACDYEIKDIVWKLEDGSESLIDMEGALNLYVKEGAGTTPYIFGTDHETGIKDVTKSDKVATVKFNLAGQRVSNDYKGVVVDNSGKKYIAQ